MGEKEKNNAELEHRDFIAWLKQHDDLADVVKRMNKKTRSRLAEVLAGSTKPPVQRGPPAAFSIADFCAAHAISEAMYFKIKAAGQGPAEMIVGRRRLISAEAAAAWRRAREAAARQDQLATA